MEKRAQLNLLRMNWERDDAVEAEEWQVENYRAWSTEELFKALPFSESEFYEQAEQANDPEEMAADLGEHLYLIIFELWRRLLPEEKTLSIFCDELDHQISAYNRNPDEATEGLTDQLAYLVELLDEALDEGLEPEKALATITPFLASDLRSFLYDFIADEIDIENRAYATELLEDFFPFFCDDPWFYFLQLRLLYVGDPDHADEQMHPFIEELKESDDQDLKLEVLAFLSASAAREFFIELASQTIQTLKTEEELQEVLEHCIHYYRCLDFDNQQAVLEALLSTRKGVSPDTPLNKQDPILTDVKDLLQHVV